jgi:hypothetical protein
MMKIYSKLTATNHTVHADTLRDLKSQATSLRLHRVRVRFTPFNAPQLLWLVQEYVTVRPAQTVRNYGYFNTETTARVWATATILDATS